MHFFLECFSTQMILFPHIQAGYWILLKPNSHIPCPCLTMEDAGHHLWTISQKPSHPGDPFTGEQLLILTFQTVRCFLLVADQHQSNCPTIQNIWKSYVQFLLICSAKINMQWKLTILPHFYQKAYLQCRTSLIRIRLMKQLKQKMKISFSQASVTVIHSTLIFYSN